jgi:hypothetical protein
MVRIPAPLKHAFNAGTYKKKIFFWGGNIPVQWKNECSYFIVRSGSGFSESRSENPAKKWTGFVKQFHVMIIFFFSFSVG